MKSDCICTTCQMPFERTTQKSKKCKSCLRARTKAWHDKRRDISREKSRQNYALNKEIILVQQKRKYVAKTFGLSLEDYQEQRAAQTHCTLCLGPFDVQGPQLDHCHSTMRVRGWLCARCNRGIGMFDDSTEKLKQAINYLEKHGK